MPFSLVGGAVFRVRESRQNLLKLGPQIRFFFILIRIDVLIYAPSYDTFGI